MQQDCYWGSCEVQAKFTLELLKKYLDNCIEQRSMTYGINQIQKQEYFDTQTVIDWAESVDDMKNISSYIFSLDFEIFSCASKMQEFVSQSSVETEYLAIAGATSWAIWIRRIL